MKQPADRSLSQLFSELTDRHVSFTLAPNAALAKADLLFALYQELPDKSPIVARAERSAIAILAGALVGMPEQAAVEQAAENPTNETIWDAMREILNIGSAPLSTQGRVVLVTVYSDAAGLSACAKQLVQQPRQISTYRLAIDGTPRGHFTLYT